jgi:hypothetical protein
MLGTFMILPSVKNGSMYKNLIIAECSVWPLFITVLGLQLLQHSGVKNKSAGHNAQPLLNLFGQLGGHLHDGPTID